ncbi:unnamed protein product [Chrysodeixis includens]|uniref:Uncharacterized protein n=1 Tax=Chrysodeixis includens TaxID=689277 RepID=A0A9P0BQW0_CHRIL|nr:unnamed protein product [Chrysodeixis includens]
MWIYQTILSLIVFLDHVTSDSALSSRSRDNGTALKVLSRKKRFLIFPDGSSVQLVFCTQNHGYLQLGNIVWFGNTAALAWELPTDPAAFDFLRDGKKVFDGKRRSDILYYLDEDGRVVDKVEYKRKIIVNPAFAKRSVDAAEQRPFLTKEIIKEMHNTQKNNNLLNYLDTTKLDFHRKERHKLYVKLEKFLQTLGWDGKECILRMLCETGQGKNDQGSFVEEIARAVFTLPKVPELVSKVHKQYDDAHGANGDCAQLYPNCWTEM